MNVILLNYNGNWNCNYEYQYVTELNNFCCVAEISPRHVAFVAIMRPPRQNLKIKHEVNYGIELLFTRCKKIKIVSSPKML